MATFKVIKSKKFQVDGVDHTHYTLGVQGRIVTLSTLQFTESDNVISENDGKLSITGELEVIKRPYTNTLGEVVQGLQFMPKFGFGLSDI